MINNNLNFLNISPSIDLRSPKEFKKGTIPNSVNLPILNDVAIVALPGVTDYESYYDHSGLNLNSS